MSALDLAKNPNSHSDTRRENTAEKGRQFMALVRLQRLCGLCRLVKQIRLRQR